MASANATAVAAAQPGFGQPCSGHPCCAHPDTGAGVRAAPQQAVIHHHRAGRESGKNQHSANRAMSRGQERRQLLLRQFPCTFSCTWRAARYSATSSAAAGTAGRIYPGNFDCDALKNTMGTSIQIKRNSPQESSGAGKCLFAFSDQIRRTRSDDRHDQHHRPWHRGQQKHRQVKPERLGMVIDVR